MRSFDFFTFNEKFFIGSNGQTIYVYDNEENEVIRFKDLIYVNGLAISPNGKTLAVRSCDGRLAFYSLEKLELIKKYRFSKIDYAQDGNFVFSKNGDFLYNVERIDNEFTSRISIYETKTFSLIKQVPNTFENTLYDAIEYDNQTKKYYLIGYERNDVTYKHNYFVCEFKNDSLINKYSITENEWDYYTDRMIVKPNTNSLAKLHKHYWGVIGN